MITLLTTKKEFRESAYLLHVFSLLDWFICIRINSHVLWRGGVGCGGQRWVQAGLAAQAAAVAAEAVHVCPTCVVRGHVP